MSEYEYDLVIVEGVELVEITEGPRLVGYRSLEHFNNSRDARRQEMSEP